jgi:hypothetical protein
MFKQTTQLSEELEDLENMQNREFSALQVTFFALRAVYMRLRDMYKALYIENSVLKTKLAEQEKTIAELTQRLENACMAVSQQQLNANQTLVSEVQETIFITMATTRTEILSFSPERLTRSQHFYEDFGSPMPNALQESEQDQASNRDRLNSLGSESFDDFDTFFDEEPNRKKIKQLAPSNRNS